MTRIAVVGGGQMGEALVAGIIHGGVERQNVVVVEHDVRRAQELSKRYEILDTTLEGAAESSDYMFLAVKPKDVAGVIRVLSDVLAELENEVVLVSIVAGVPTSFFETQLSAGSPVVRVMPNTPMLVGAGVCVVSTGRYARREHVTEVRGFLKGVGTVLEVPESEMDTVTAVSGSGPAYFFLMVEALVDAAVSRGLSRQVATQLAIGTMAGSAKMLQDTEKSAAELRESVTSPGGTTAAGLRAFEEGGFRRMVYNVVEAVEEKSVSLRPKA